MPTDQLPGPVAPRRYAPRTSRTLLILVATLVAAVLPTTSGASLDIDGGAPLRLAQSSAQVDVEGSTVTVQVFGIPGHQVRAQLADGRIASTALITASGPATMVFDLQPGSYEVEVITFDPAGQPNSVGTYTVRIAGPPPPPPGVTVTPGSTGDNRTVVDVNGTPGERWKVDIVRESRVTQSKDGDFGEDGVARAVFLLESGPWGFLATASNANGTSEANGNQFSVEIGPPAPPALSLESIPGGNPIALAVQGPRGGKVEVTATSETGQTVARTAEVNITGNGSLALEMDEEGPWTISGIAVDFTGQRSEPATLDEAVPVRLQGPPLSLELLDAPDGEFAYKVITDVGVEIHVSSDTTALERTFVADSEETEIREQVPEGAHLIEVRAVDEFGNESNDLLSSTSASGGGGTSWGPLLLILLGISLAFAAYGFLKRQELIDWWNSRQYR
jgi:hypothetical protein